MSPIKEKQEDKNKENGEKMEEEPARCDVKKVREES